MIEKLFVLALALGTVFMVVRPADASDQFRLTTGHPGCIECNGVSTEDVDGLASYIHEDGSVTLQNGDSIIIGQLDFAPSQNVQNNTTAIEQLFLGQRSDDNTVMINNIENRFSAQLEAQKEYIEQMAAISGALDMIGPTDQGRVKVNFAATTVNGNSHGMGITVVGTHYGGKDSARTSYGLGLASSVGGGTLSDSMLKGHLGFEF